MGANSNTRYELGWVTESIRIGGSLAAPPSHTTVRTGPYTAVRRVKRIGGQTRKTEGIKVGIGKRDIEGLEGAGPPGTGGSAALF